jgi:hypothetical protein
MLLSGMDYTEGQRLLELGRGKEAASVWLKAFNGLTGE